MGRAEMMTHSFIIILYPRSYFLTRAVYPRAAVTHRAAASRLGAMHAMQRTLSSESRVDIRRIITCRAPQITRCAAMVQEAPCMAGFTRIIGFIVKVPDGALNR